MSNEFIILALPRTGSTLLQEALNARDDTVCFCELFHVSRMRAQLLLDRVNKEKGLAVQMGQTVQSMLGNTRALQLDTPFVGSKEIAGHVDRFTTRTYIGGKKLITLVRNPAAVAASSVVAAHTGVWNAYTDGTFMAGGLPTHNPADNIVVPHDIVRDMVEALRTIQAVSRGCPSVLQLSYDEVTGNFPQAYRRVCDFLGMPYKEPTIRTKKLREDTLSGIANLEEIHTLVPQDINSELPLR